MRRKLISLLVVAAIAATVLGGAAGGTPALTDAEIDAYLASGEWRGKAGGYAIQGRAEALIRFVAGSHSGVIGLPLFETRALLLSAGYPLG